MSQRKSRLGILGVKRDPRKPIIFSFSSEDWPSDDSEDNDYLPDNTSPGEGRTDDCVTLGRAEGSRNSVCDCQKNQDTGSCKCKITNQRSLKKQDTWAVSESSRNEGITLKLNLTKTSVKRKRNDSRVNKKPKKESNQSKKQKIVRKEQVSSNADTCLEKDIAPVCSEELWGKMIPEEILVKIFEHAISDEGIVSFFRRVSKICRLWKKVAETKRLWEKVDLSWGTGKHTEDKLVMICKTNLSRTIELNLAGWGKHLTTKGITAIAQHCPKLSTIVVSHCTKISSNSIQLLADSCPDLRSIDLCGVSKEFSKTNSPLSLSCLKHLFTECGGRLTHFRLAENFIINFTAIVKAIGELCPNLQMLDVSNLQRGSSLSLPLESLQHGCPHLRVLLMANSVISFCHCPSSAQVKAPGFPELEELSIAMNNNFRSLLDDNDLERLVKTSQKLKLLDVRGCAGITASGLIRIPAWDIQHLYLSRCAASRFPDLELVLRKWCHSLKEVDLSWSTNSEAINQGVMALSANESHSPPLLILDLHGSSISYDTIKVLLSQCKLLQNLNLQSCRGLPRGIKRLYSGEELACFRQHVIDGHFEEPASIPDD